MPGITNVPEEAEAGVQAGEPLNYRLASDFPEELERLIRRAHGICIGQDAIRVSEAEQAETFSDTEDPMEEDSPSEVRHRPEQAVQAAAAQDATRVSVAEKAETFSEIEDPMEEDSPSEVRHRPEKVVQAAVASTKTDANSISAANGDYLTNELHPTAEDREQASATLLGMRNSMARGAEAHPTAEDLEQASAALLGMRNSMARGAEALVDTDAPEDCTATDTETGEALPRDVFGLGIANLVFAKCEDDPDDIYRPALDLSERYAARGRVIRVFYGDGKTRVRSVIDSSIRIRDAESVTDDLTCLYSQLDDCHWWRRTVRLGLADVYEISYGKGRPPPESPHYRNYVHWRIELDYYDTAEKRYLEDEDTLLSGQYPHLAAWHSKKLEIGPDLGTHPPLPVEHYKQVLHMEGGFSATAYANPNEPCAHNAAIASPDDDDSFAVGPDDGSYTHQSSEFPSPVACVVATSPSLITFGSNQEDKISGSSPLSHGEASGEQDRRDAMDGAGIAEQDANASHGEASGEQDRPDAAGAPAASGASRNVRTDRVDNNEESELVTPSKAAMWPVPIKAALLDQWVPSDTTSSAVKSAPTYSKESPSRINSGFAKLFAGTTFRRAQTKQKTHFLPQGEFVKASTVVEPEVKNRLLERAALDDEIAILKRVKSREERASASLHRETKPAVTIAVDCVVSTLRSKHNWDLAANGASTYAEPTVGTCESLAHACKDLMQLTTDSTIVDLGGGLGTAIAVMAQHLSVKAISLEYDPNRTFLGVNALCALMDDQEEYGKLLEQRLAFVWYNIYALFSFDFASGCLVANDEAFPTHLRMYIAYVFRMSQHPQYIISTKGGKSKAGGAEEELMFCRVAGIRELARVPLSKIGSGESSTAIIYERLPSQELKPLPDEWNFMRRGTISAEAIEQEVAGWFVESRRRSAAQQLLDYVHANLPEKTRSQTLARHNAEAGIIDEVYRENVCQATFGLQCRADNPHCKRCSVCFQEMGEESLVQRNSDIHGKGIFTKESIAGQRRLLVHFKGTLCNKAEVLTPERNALLMRWNSTQVLDSSKESGVQLACNHSCLPNARIAKFVDHQGREQLGLFSNTPFIPADAEITANLSRLHAEPFDCECGRALCCGSVAGFRSPNILLLGMSLLHTERLSTYEQQGIDLTDDPRKLHIMHCRDTVRCYALEQAFGAVTYTVSLSEVKERHLHPSRHLTCNMSDRKFVSEELPRFMKTNGVDSFDEVQLDYFWNPGGYARDRYGKDFFRLGIPQLAQANIIGPEGSIVLPFCAAILQMILGEQRTYKRLFHFEFLTDTIASLRKNRLLAATEMIDEDVMREVFEKEKHQWKKYCGITKQQVSIGNNFVRCFGNVELAENKVLRIKFMVLKKKQL